MCRHVTLCPSTCTTGFQANVMGRNVKITAEMGGKAKEQIPSPAGKYTIWRVRKDYVITQKGNMQDRERVK